MKTKLISILAAVFSLLFVPVLWAQDLGPQIKQIKDGIYVYVGKEFNSNCGIILTQEGVVLIDSGHNPTDSRAILAAVKKLTPLPVRFLIDTEPHPTIQPAILSSRLPRSLSHTTGATESMKGQQPIIPNATKTHGRISRRCGLPRRISLCPAAYRISQKMTLNVGERTFELLYQKGVHSEADTAVWLPKERVLFSASAVVVNQYNILRPFVTIPDILGGGQNDEGFESGVRDSRPRHTWHSQNI